MAAASVFPMTQAAENRADALVTVSVVRRVKPGLEGASEELLKAGIGRATAEPGHLGVTVLRPERTQGPPDYGIIFRFDSPANLERWTESRACRDWLAQLAALEERPAVTQVLTGLETWLKLPGEPARSPPPRYKMALITWAAIFPVITGLLALIGPFVEPLPLVARTLLLTAVMVPAMTYLVMPAMSRLFARWLHPTDRSDA